MEPRSLIVMATFNGEEFIKEQIESIRKQTYKNWNLLIRDDGSNDKTIPIIKEFVARDDRIRLIENTTTCHGAYINFWTLLHEAKKMEAYDFYFFSDQDDVWPSERMQWMLDEAQKQDVNMPLLVYGDMQVIDRQGKIVYESLDAIMGIGQMSGYTEYYSSGFVWGCNAMINNVLFQKVPLMNLDNPHVNVMSHDNYYAKFAIAIGTVRYIPNKCIKHRRYGNNTTGNYQMKLSPFTIIRRAIMQYSSVAKTHALGYVQTIQTIEMMKDERMETPEVLDVENAIYSGGVKGVSIMAKQGVKRKQTSRTLGIYLIMLMGSYKKYMKCF